MVKRKLWKFNRTNPTEDAKPKLPLTLEITEIEHSLARIAAKANNVLSSPIRKTMDSVRRDAPALFWEDKRHRIQSEILYRRVSEMITKKPHGRTRTQMGENLRRNMLNSFIQAKESEEAGRVAQAETKMLAKIKNASDAGRRYCLTFPGRRRCRSLSIEVPDRKTEEKPAALTGTHQHFPSSPLVLPESGERDWDILLLHRTFLTCNYVY
jgi:hypothetical protein